MGRTAAARDRRSDGWKDGNWASVFVEVAFLDVASPRRPVKEPTAMSACETNDVGPGCDE